MTENNKIGTYNFVAEPFHVDFTGRLTLGVLGNHLLNCAGFHATERGFGMAGKSAYKQFGPLYWGLPNLDRHLYHPRI